LAGAGQATVVPVGQQAFYRLRNETRNEPETPVDKQEKKGDL